MISDKFVYDSRCENSSQGAENLGESAPASASPVAPPNQLRDVITSIFAILIALRMMIVGEWIWAAVTLAIFAIYWWYFVRPHLFGVPPLPVDDAVALLNQFVRESGKPKGLLVKQASPFGKAVSLPIRHLLIQFEVEFEATPDGGMEDVPQAIVPRPVCVFYVYHNGQWVVARAPIFNLPMEDVLKAISTSSAAVISRPTDNQPS